MKGMIFAPVLSIYPYFPFNLTPFFVLPDLQFGRTEYYRRKLMICVA
jgi:hypothetical protein